MLRSLSLCLTLLPVSALAETRFALVVGANAGWSQDRALRHAVSDAQHVAEVLAELGEFERDNVVLLRDPDTAEVRAGLAALAKKASAVDGQTLVFFYYSGHADDRWLHLKGDPLGFDELNATLRDLPAQVRVGVLDACRSGALVSTKGGAPVATFDVTVVDELTVRGLALLTSSGADELSQEQRALQGSVFTHHLISGLRGAADFDSNGQVTLAEAYRHAYQRTEADTAATLAPQRPAFRYDIKGKGELVMTWPVKSTASLLLPRGAGERYVVVDDEERWVVAEGSASPDHELRVALPAGKYRVKQVLADQLQVASLTLADGARVDAKGLAYSSMPLSSGLVKGVDLADVVVHPRTAFWFVAGSAVLAGIAWAVAGGTNLQMRGQYAAVGRPLSPRESQTVTGWAVASDVAMGLTATLLLAAVFTW
ncbi:MAG: caspase family protein [Myxococcaceae bacterium]|nr:caspase family protein [Myxococcaceae bacterium]